MMAVDSLIEALAVFQLDSLPEDWTETVWDHEFMDINDIPLPDEYALYIEDSNISVSMRQASKAIKEWLSSEENNGPSWQTLTSYNVDTKKLLPIICYLISNGLVNPMDENWRQICLEATSLYYNFLCIPGSYAFSIFHPNLFSKALASFKLGTRLSIGNKRKPKAQNTRKTNSQPLDESDLIFESFEGGGQPLNNQERTSLIKGLNSVIHNLHNLMKHFSLKSQPDSMEHIIQRLVDVTRLEVNTSAFRFGRDPGYEAAQSTIFSLAYNAYILIGSLCQPFHGNVENSVTVVTQFLLPSIMMLPASGTEPSPKDLSIIKDHAVYFLQYLMLKLKDEADKGITILIQHLCTKIQDRSELRQKGAQVVVDLMRSLPMNAYSQLVSWFFKFAYHVKACHRLFALEVISKLLYEVERHGNTSNQNELPTNSQEEPSLQSSYSQSDPPSEDPLVEPMECIVKSNLQRDVPSHRFLLAVLVGRCCDSSGTVRIKALQTLSECTTTNNVGIRSLMEELFVTPYLNVEDIFQSETVENEFISYKRFVKLLRHCDDTRVDPLPGAKAVFRMLEERIQDDKVLVRKAALQVIENLMRFNRKCMTHELLKTMFDFCRDPAVTVRKHMIRTLTDVVLQYPDHTVLPQMWVDHVLPRIVDPEVTVQDKVLECLEILIVNNMVVYDRMTSTVHQLPWDMLTLVMRSDKRTFLYNACSVWEKKKVITDKTVGVIKTHIGTENNIPAWVFLAAITEYMDLRDPLFLLDFYRQQYADNRCSEVLLCGLVLECMKSLWPTVDAARREAVYELLLDQLSGFQLNVQLIRPALDLILATPPFPKNNALAVANWAPPLVQTCEAVWRGKVDLLCRGDASSEDVSGFLQVVMTYGDVVQVCKSRVKIGGDTFHLLKRLFDDVPDTEETAAKGFRAGLIVVTGKLCVTSEKFAKQAVPWLGELLKAKMPAAVKINVISVFYDMCIKCTSLVEPVIGDVCLSLKDCDGVVREKTLVTLIQLLQEDYLKIRADLFFHILSMLCDPLPSVQSMASYYMTQCLLSKQPNFMHSHLIHSMFYYNNYQHHKDYSKVRLNEREAKLFGLSTKERCLVYRFMLDNMTDDQRFNLTHKLCTDILNGVTEGRVSLEGPGTPLLKDTFYVLSSEEIRLSTLRSRADDEPPVNEAEMATVILASTKKTLISQLVKKNVIENIVPILTQLKHKLEKMKSPLITNLMVYLRDLMRDYKAEIKQIFNEDKQLAAEILFDLKTLEDQEKERKRQLEEKHSRAVNETDSESEYDSNNTTPVASPGQPVVPAEVRPVMENLTPQVRRNVEPYLAKVCQQVEYSARASKSSSPATFEKPNEVAPPDPELVRAPADASTIINIVQPDGTPSNLDRFNKMKLVVNRMASLDTPARTPGCGRNAAPSGMVVSTPNTMALPSVTQQFPDMTPIARSDDEVNRLLLTPLEK